MEYTIERIHEAVFQLYHEPQRRKSFAASHDTAKRRHRIVQEDHEDVVIQATTYRVGNIDIASDPDKADRNADETSMTRSSGFLLMLERNGKAEIAEFLPRDPRETRTTRDWYKVSQVSGEPIFR
ncbi:hypothetical protein WN48_02883 [Eufriesea mexicana]|uniref:Uncharacterized protein n=1 Tax=Eufriesea mexicana TaxID=516756 RepID=A0A310SNQ3_9HYME|nr:hypothetical protein WN48_02883 [Eufriesea mexicana]